MVEPNIQTDSPNLGLPYKNEDGSPDQYWARGGLADHPHHIELRGSPNELSWPRVCANCGNAASEQIRVEKAFRPRPRRRTRGSSGGRVKRYRITGAPIPFCSACAAEHRATQKKLTGVEKVMSVFINIMTIPAIGLGWMSWMLLKGMGESLTTSVSEVSLAAPEVKLGLSLAAMVVGGFFWTLYLMWETTRVDRIDPRTEITLACDFSEDVSEPFEKERRIYAMRNETFARAFADFNKDRVWTESDQSRSRKLSFVTALVFLGALAVIAALLAKYRP